MTRLEARVAALEARVALLERRTTKTPALASKRYVTITQAQVDARWNLWIEYTHLKTLEVCGAIYSRRRGDEVPTGRAWFCVHVVDDEGHRFSQREFERWFSRFNTFPLGSRQDLRVRGAIRREIERLHAAGYFIGMPQQEIDRLHSIVM
jgi:hypothetical protein